MTPIPRLRPLTGALLALALIVFGAPWSTSRVVSAQNQTLFLSITDASGEPVTDLTADELIVRWDDEDCETLALELINRPVRITVFIDNHGGGRVAHQDMREGLKLFLDAIPEDVEVALATLAGRPRFLVRHTADKEEIARAIDLIVPDVGATAFRDALVEEADRLNDDEERQYLPVIVMIAGGDNPEGSTSLQRAYDEMMQRMVDAQATVHTRMFMDSSRRGTTGQQVQVGVNVGERTGGTYESIAASTAFRTNLQELGRDIARRHRLTSNQYRLTYAPPDGAFNQPTMRIASSRSDITLLPTLDGNVR